jgi:hypothetical protein
MTLNEMTDLTSRTERLVDALSGSILSTVEVAAERIALAAEVARVSQRMSAFSAVLEAIGAQKDALAGRLAAARGPLRALLQRQIEVLTAQEVAVLERAGAASQVARDAIEAADEPLYKREGSRFVALGGSANGTPAGSHEH